MNPVSVDWIEVEEFVDVPKLAAKVVLTLTPIITKVVASDAISLVFT
ncbi:hypothetical protein GCM10025859_62770 [Alicyclobacillus fastidiosus]|nr:hypothetical protein GCM10025859_60600 [Alicyclobacillus fastidiosus]GMA65837.1 hypothetical protein GCM10025859_62770 [Alicyclobacillus fastidiosus]